MATSGENIMVAVRVRPFSTREKQRNAQLIVAMDGQATMLMDPNNTKAEPRKFAYDYSYWSHDGYKAKDNGYLEPANKKYIDQVKLYNDIGRTMLDNAWKGYNCSIFAYGQTSSGKSYTIMGFGNNQGLVPRTCEDLFEEIESKKKGGVNFEVTFSMLEIYNEQVRDLLNKKKTPQGGLKVKESPERGFYVEGLTIVPVGSYKEIKLRMNEGDRQRTIAATKMNETSSRAHTIVTISFTQNIIKAKTSKRSNINLVDLAGSERAKQTEATGDRFEEAKNINKSLMTLGNVIKALCDKSKGKSSQHVPYRDAILTKLLKNTLGGNSKTVMIAAISPDAENYEQTLSTLRYADRAKSIRTDAKINQGQTDKMIKELIAEKERLLKELENAKLNKESGYSDEDLQKMKDEQRQEIQRYKEMMKDSEKSWEKRLADARKEMEEISAKEKQQEEAEKKKPHLSNLNEDPALTGKVVHVLQPGSNTVGNGKDGNEPTIVLNGPRIAKNHAEIVNKKGEIMLHPVQGVILHNGSEVTSDVKLTHQDRLRFGSNNLFVFSNPVEAETLKKKGRIIQEITFEFAQSEIVQHSGLNISDEDALLQEEVMTIMQLVNDVNAMAEDMTKPVEFSIVLVSPDARGLDTGRTEVFVKVHDLDNTNEYMWNKNRFLNRQVHMQEMYQQFDENGEVPRVAKDKDPFYELPDTEVIVGVVSVPLNYLSYMMEFEEEPLTVIDYRAKQSGFLKVELLPCDSSGREDVDLCVEDPMDLVAKPMAFKIKIHQAMNLEERFIQTWCRYRFYLDADYTKTDVGGGKNPKYDHMKMIKFNKLSVDHKLIDYLREKSLPIEIWGRQGDNSKGSASSLGSRQREEKQKLHDEVQGWKSKTERLQDKLNRIQAIISKMPANADTKKITKILAEKV